ncbi:phage tail assembly chaperone [Nitrospirillum viridazoti]|uniref:phage tail assembly chaperone n=1 Tax=Nitrospirillum viridazoti TaxID=3144925 RepID=UPI0011AC3063|nr:phage tail assembly chaperone [Nitrospirillum amazonense]TWB33096.1 phage tail assembly chaperone [Nitrospirillum amazonense]
MKRLLIYEAATGRIRWEVQGGDEHPLFDPDDPSYAGLAAISLAQDVAVNAAVHEVRDGVLVEIDADRLRAAAAATTFRTLREERFRRLSFSDVAVLPDRWAAMSDAQRAAWTAYRQALRDLPANTTDPTAPAWPVPPS